MVGLKKRVGLPINVINSVTALYKQAFEKLGPVRMEWVADDHQTWVVQFHRGGTQSFGRTIYPGSPRRYIDFDVNSGLEALRAAVAQAQETGAGIVLRGDVGITSHLGDILRSAEVPSRIEA